ncbi:hypothetical protein BDN71DRAFT_1388529, partial [Pleurotus eryngii]
HQCPQCFDNCLFCCSCIMKCHCNFPFHQVQWWNNMFFKPCTLQSLGLHIQLGHPLSDTCANPTPIYNNMFIVITSHSIVTVSLNFCNCLRAISCDVQLLHACLFLATTLDSRTAATFEVLHLFQLLTFGSKVSSYEFYHALSHLTNNTSQTVPVSVFVNS